MKRWICAMLLVVLLAQAVPFSALATVVSGKPITDAELAKAYSLTGKNETDIVYHNGMGVSATMNARQLRDWLQDIQSGDLHSVCHILSQADMALSDLSESDPSAHRRLTVGNNAKLLERSEALQVEAEELRQTMRFYEDRLQESITTVEQSVELMKSGEEANVLYDYERVRYAERIRNASAAIADIRSDIVDQYDAWQRDIDRWQNICNGSYQGGDANDRAVGDWLDDVFLADHVHEENETKILLQNNASTRASRLRTNESVLSGNNESTTVTVLRDDEIGIQLLVQDENGQSQNLVGQVVRAWDHKAADQSNTPQTATTDKDGVAVFSINSFTVESDGFVDIDIDVDCDAKGYHSIASDHMLVEKGKRLIVHLQKNDGTPYIYKASFNGFDCYYNQHKIYYSHSNDYDYEIKAYFRDTSSAPIVPMLYYAEDEEGTNEVKLTSGEKKKDRTGDYYLFKGPWKMELRPDKARKIYFKLTDDKNAKKYFTMIQPIYSIVDKPTDLSSVLGGILKPSGGFGFKIPSWGETVNVDIGLNKLLHFVPKVMLDINGLLTITIGSVWGEKSNPDTMTWQAQEYRDLERKERDIEKDFNLAKVKAKLGAPEDQVNQRKYNAWKGGASVGIFLLLCGKWEKDPDESEVYQVNLTGSLGGWFTYWVDYTHEFAVATPIGPIPFYINFGANFTLSVALGLEWNMRWKNLDVIEGSASFTFHDFDLGFQINLSLTLGIGVKGVLSFFVKGACCFSIVVGFIKGRSPSVDIDLGLSVTLGAEFLVFTVSVQVWHDKWKLYSTDPQANAYPLLEHYTAAALAKRNGETEDKETVPSGASYGAPQQYPELGVELSPVPALSGLENVSGTVKLLEYRGEIYAFFIKDGRIRYKLVSGNQLDEEDVFSPKEIQNLTERFDGTVPLAEMKDYAFDVCVGTADTSGDYVMEFIVLTALCAKDVDGQGYPVGDAEQTALYTVYLWRSSQGGGLTTYHNGTHNEFGYGFYRAMYTGQGSDIPFVCGDIQIANCYYKDVSGKTGGHFDRNTVGYVNVSLTEFTRPDETRVVRRGYAHTEQNIHNKEEYVNTQQAATDEKIESGAGSGYKRVFGRSGSDLSWIAVSRSEGGEGDQGAIEFFDPAMKGKSIVLATGDIHAFSQAVLTDEKGNESRAVFYAEDLNTDDGGNHFRLKSLYVNPTDRKDGDGNLELGITATDYDISLLTEQFKLAVIAGAINLYWLSGERMTDDDGTERDVYRVNIVNYDQFTNTLSNPSVCAEFALPAEDMVIHDLILSETGKGYLTAAKMPDDAHGDSASMKKTPLTVYSFTTNLMPVLDLTGQIIEDTLVCPGDYDDFNLVLMNSGNMAATSIDVDIVLQENNVDTVVGKLHGSCLNPTDSSIQMGDETIFTGEKAFYRLEDFDSTPQQRDWVLGETNVNYVVEDGALSEKRDGESKTHYVKTNAILPGARATFKSTMQIPAEWNGKKQIVLRLSSYRTYVNWVGAIANAAGRQTISNVARTAVPNAGATEITYVRDPKTGKMVLKSEGVQGIKDSRISEPASVPGTVRTQTLHDLQVTDRVYRGPDDERMLQITVTDLAHTGESFTLSGTMYLDDSKEPITFSMGHFPDAVSDAATHNFDMPLSALVDPYSCQKARIVITGDGIKETAMSNNEFTLYLDGKPGPLTILRQPRDVTIQEGESASFSVVVTGGVWPYSYQWQMWDEKHQKWVDIPNATDSVLSRENVEKKWDGARFRCVITDRAETTVISDPATLTVRDSVDTGDHSSLPLYLAMAVIALALLWLLRRRMNRAQQ